jgi:DNA-binding XRE family transcriptional regulator
MHLGDKLKMYRKGKDMDQKQMADLLDIGYRTYQEIERTGIVTKAKTKEQISKILAGQGQVSASNTQEDGFKVSVEDYIAEIKNSRDAIIADLRQQKDYLQALLMKNSDGFKSVNSSLDQIKATDDAHWKQVAAAIQTSLKSLARLEKKPEVSLVEEMGNFLQQLYLESETKGTAPEKRR